MSIDINQLDAESILQGPKGRGAAQAEVVRELDHDDLVTLAQTNELAVQGRDMSVSGAPAIQKLRYKHHQLARLLVQGLSNEDCAAAIGMHPNRISMMKQDPTFQELLEHYDAQAEQSFLDVQNRLMLTGMSALERLEDKLDDDEEDLSVGELRGIMQDTFDRAGFGPTTKTESTKHHSASGDLIEAMKQNIQQRSQGRVVEKQPAAEEPEDADFEEGTSVASSESQDNPGAGDSGVNGASAGDSEQAAEEDPQE